MTGRVAIVGAGGMLGRDLADVLAATHEVVGFDLPECDLRDLASLAPVAASAPAVIVNCAALTDVDGCETQRELAQAVNGAGAGTLARLARDCGAWLVHLSTDYVFDGTLGRPYREDDAPAPLSVYGATKLAGERAVAAAGGDALILRTQSLFGVHGRNFVEAILRAAATRPQLEVVQDQVSSPTYTRHLAGGIARLLALPDRGAIGPVLHLVNSGACSWHAFAEAIVARSHPGVPVRPITAASLARPASRPAQAVLDTSRFEALTGRRLPGWETALEEYLAERARIRGATPPVT